MEQDKYQILEAQKTENQTQPATILIAEDDEANHQFFREVLKLEKYNVVVAYNGLEAVNAVKNKPDIRLVLMDIRMPVMDGIEATKQIKSIRKDLPIIALTAFALTGDEQIMIAAGCDDYLSKPVRMSLLLSKIKHYLNAKKKIA